MSNNQLRFLLCFAAVIFTWVVILLFAAKPVNGPAVEAFIQNTVGGQQYLRFATALSSPDVSALAQFKYETKYPKATWDSDLQKISKMFQERNVKFVKFEHYHSEGLGDAAVSEVTGWLKLPEQPHNYFLMSLKLTGSLAEPTLEAANIKLYDEPGDLSYPSEVLTPNGLATMSFDTLVAVALALVSSAIAAVSFTLCLLSGTDASRYVWAALSWIGIAPVQVELANGLWHFHWFGFIAPAGSFIQHPLGFWLYTYGSLVPQEEIYGQVASFSLPIGFFLIFSKQIMSLIRSMEMDRT